MPKYKLKDEVNFDDIYDYFTYRDSFNYVLMYGQEDIKFLYLDISDRTFKFVNGEFTSGKRLIKKLLKLNMLEEIENDKF